MEHPALSILMGLLVCGCVRERVVVVEGPVPGYQGFAPPAEQAAVRVYPEYRTPPSRLRPVPPPIPAPVVLNKVDPPLVDPPLVGLRPNPVKSAAWPPPFYFPPPVSVYRLYDPYWVWGPIWPPPHFRRPIPWHHPGHVHMGYPHHHHFGHRRH